MQITDEQGRRCKFAANDVLLIAERLERDEFVPNEDGEMVLAIDKTKCDVTIALVDKAITITAGESFDEVSDKYNYEWALVNRTNA